MKELEIFEQRGVTQIIFALYQGDMDKETMVTYLLKAVNVSQKAAYSALKRLNEYGLIAERHVDTPFKLRFIRLTDKGFKVAEKLKEIGEELTDK